MDNAAPLAVPCFVGLGQRLQIRTKLNQPATPPAPGCDWRPLYCRRRWRKLDRALRERTVSHPDPIRDEQFLARVRYRQAEAIGGCSLPPVSFSDSDGEGSANDRAILPAAAR